MYSTQTRKFQIPKHQFGNIINTVSTLYKAGAFDNTINKVRQGIANPSMVWDSILRKTGFTNNTPQKGGIPTYDLSKGKYGVYTNDTSPHNSTMPGTNPKDKFKIAGIPFSTMDNLNFRQPSEYKEDQQGMYNMRNAKGWVGVTNKGDFRMYNTKPDKDTVNISPIMQRHVVKRAEIDKNNGGVNLIGENGKPVPNNITNLKGNYLMSSTNNSNPISYNSRGMSDAKQVTDSLNAYISRQPNKQSYYWPTDSGRMEYFPYSPITGITQNQFVKTLLQTPVFQQGNKSGGAHFVYSKFQYGGVKEKMRQSYIQRNPIKSATFRTLPEMTVYGSKDDTTNTILENSELTEKDKQLWYKNGAPKIKFFDKDDEKRANFDSFSNQMTVNGNNKMNPQELRLKSAAKYYGAISDSLYNKLDVTKNLKERLKINKQISLNDDNNLQPIYHKLNDLKDVYAPAILNREEFYAELSHARQFKKNPDRFNQRLVEGHQYEDSDDPKKGRYGIPGQLEYEAHKIIEPGLLKESYKPVKRKSYLIK